MEQELECPICLEQFQTPKVLPCQHTFCERCLTQIIQSGLVKCPICREVHQVPSGGFRNNVTLQRLLNNVRNQQAGRIQGTYNNAINPPPPGAGLVLTAPPLEFNNSTHHLQHIQPAQEPHIQPGNFGWWHDAHRNNEAARHNNLTANQNTTRTNNTDNPSAASFKTRTVKCIGVVRNAIRKVVSSFLNGYKLIMVTTAGFFLVLTLAGLVEGGVRLNSKCPKEKNVAVYLFVKGWFAALFWIIILILGLKKRLIDVMDNLFIEVYVVAEASFSFIWRIVGSVWIMGDRSGLEEQCPWYVSGWNERFINFAYFLVVTEWIGVVAFLFYSGYIIFDRNNTLENSNVQT